MNQKINKNYKTINKRFLKYFFFPEMKKPNKK